MKEKKYFFAAILWKYIPGIHFRNDSLDSSLVLDRNAKCFSLEILSCRRDLRLSLSLRLEKANDWSSHTYVFIHERVRVRLRKEPLEIWIRDNE